MCKKGGPSSSRLTGELGKLQDGGRKCVATDKVNAHAKCIAGMRGRQIIRHIYMVSRTGRHSRFGNREGNSQAWVGALMLQSGLNNCAKLFFSFGCQTVVPSCPSDLISRKFYPSFRKNFIEL